MTLDPALLPWADKIIIVILIVFLFLLARGQRAATFPVAPSVSYPTPPVAIPPVVVPPVVEPPVVVPPVVPPVIVQPPAVPPAASGPIHKLVGKGSEFGGPNDTGSGDPNEGLALVGAADIPNFQDVLLPGAHGDALFRQLDPSKHYIACRWDYSETPKSYLKKLHVIVKNPTTGKTASDVRPVDWGPNAKTGRVADLSPGLMAFLGLQTDATVEVDIPLPAGGPTQPAAQEPPVVGDGLVKNTWPTQAECPTFYGSPSTVAASLVKVHCPWVLTVEGTHTQNITIHSKCAASLTRVLNYIWKECGESQEKINEFGYNVFDGSYNPRNIGGTNTPSVHSYAAAMDWNAAANPQHAPLSQTKFKANSLIVLAFKSEGWIWGGDWSPASIDAMHFQAARVR